MEIYLDNSATTACLPEAVEAMRELLTEDYGNPSSLHTKGFDAEKRVRAARASVAASLKCDEKEIIFTSGGTEANNLAVFGAAAANRRRGRHIITTMIEHPSVYQPFAALAGQGYDVTFLPVDEHGVVSPERLSEAVREDTILVSMMHVNNEIGSVQPIEEAAKRIHETSPDCVFHVDAVQSYGKLPVFPKRIGVDALSVSGHKLHGPKGSGFLFVKEGTKLSPHILGGGQENGMRSGTENVPAIAGLGAAVDALFGRKEALAENTERLYGLRERLAEGIRSIEGTTINGCPGREGAPHIVSVTTDGVRSEVLLHALEDKQIYVSAGSACSSNRPAKSRTLMSIGLDDDALESTIRLSLSVHTTEEEIDACIEALRELLPVLRKFKRR